MFNYPIDKGEWQSIDIYIYVHHPYILAFATIRKTLLKRIINFAR